MFEDSTFESTGRIQSPSRSWMPLALLFNGSMLTALILFPLMHPEALPKPLVNMLLTAPPAPTAPQPMPQTSQARAFQGVSEMIGLQLTVPRRLPTGIAKILDVGPAPAGGDLLGMANGNGVPGGVDVFRSSSPVAVQPAARPSAPVHVSGGVATGLLLQKTPPVYPPIAKAVRVQGTVVLQAIISKAGTIENLRVVSGPTMLQQSALDAVKSWRYKPYLLNGEPVAVETTINVNFVLGQ